MRKILLSATLMASMAGLPALVGCDRTVSETKTEQQKSDGTAVTTHDKVEKKADGTVVETSEKKVDK